MPSQIDPSQPVDGTPAVKADLRANLQSAKDEIEALRTGKTDFGHQHVLADLTDSGALASKDVVHSDDIATAAVTTQKPAAVEKQDAAGGRRLASPKSAPSAGGMPPLANPAANAIDICAFITRDTATCYGFPGGQDFS